MGHGMENATILPATICLLRVFGDHSMISLRSILGNVYFSNIRDCLFVKGYLVTEASSDDWVLFGRFWQNDYQVLLLLMGIFWFSSQCYQDRSLYLFNVERKFPLKVATPGRCWFSFWSTRFPWEKSKWKNKKFSMTWSISYGSKNTSENALVWILVRKDFMPFLFKGRVDTEPWIS